MKFLYGTIILTALLLVSFTTHATALLISQEAGYGYNSATKNWNLQDVAWGVDSNGDIDYTRNLTFTKFDQTLGRLTGAQLNIYTRANGILSATNNSQSPLTITSLSNLVYILYQPPSAPLSLNQLESPNLAPVNSLVLAGGTTYLSGDVSFIPAAYPDSYNYLQANVAAFIGTAGATFDIPVGAGNLVTIVSNGADPTFVITNKAGVYATLDYSYETIPVPEPSTFVLLSTFFALLLAGRNGFIRKILR